MNRRGFLSAIMSGSAAVLAGVKLDLREFNVICGPDTMEKFRSGALKIPGTRQFATTPVPYRLDSIAPPNLVHPFCKVGEFYAFHPSWLHAQYEAGFLIERGTDKISVFYIDRHCKRLLDSTV